MWRFVLRENIIRFQALLKMAKPGDQQETLRQLLREAELELDELEKASTPEIAKRDDWLDAIANRAVDQAMALAHAQFASLQIHDERREHLLILAQKNHRAKYLNHLEQVKPGDGSACGRCLLEEAPVAVEDVNSDAAFEPHRKAANEAGFRAVQALPVRDASGDLLAVLSIYFESPQRLSPEKLDRLVDFADSISRNLASHLRD